MVGGTLRSVCLLLCALVALTTRPLAHAETHDPLDPFDTSSAELFDGDDSKKSAEELIAEGNLLLMDERLLDARTKLLHALQKDPKAYQAHILLAGYYLVHVGHFRLALKYIRQAQSLFEERFGPPPYTDPFYQNQHARILYLLSQIRLDLDNYQGSLDVLDEFTSYGYYAEWYPGTRAWVLMKLGRIEDAIKVAKLGVLADAERGRTLNMLGILLSMHGERQASLQVFKDAIAYEFASGERGEPATPLNNSGEVYKEIFEDDRAEASWLRATSLPDGCQHVLPSLNLALLYLEQLNYRGAKQAIDSFEACVAQYPLRNGEEHRALVHLARGRIALLTGHVEEAVKHLEEALERRQWFGKIGTSVEDLTAAASISMAQALRRRIAVHSTAIPTSFAQRLEFLESSLRDQVRAWWLLRRGRQVLSEELRDFEDLSIRNTDSLLEYPTLGEVMRGFPVSSVRARIAREEQSDSRAPAKPFYDAYLGESLLAHGSTGEGRLLLQQSLLDARPRYDDLLRAHAMTTILETLSEDTVEYGSVAEEVFSLARPQLRNHALRLPVNVAGADDEITDALERTMFIVDNSRTLANKVNCTRAQGTIRLEFVPRSTTQGIVRASGASLEETMNRFVDEVFTIQLP